MTADPAVLGGAGPKITYTVTVRNTGGSALRDLAVAAVAQNLPALVCTPTAQGGTLAVGATTVCSARRTSLQEDLRSRGGTVDATAAGFAPDGTAVSATGHTTLTTATGAPSVTDDKVEVVRSTPYVVLPATTNDAPSPGGPVLNPGLTGVGPFSTNPSYDKRLGSWEVLPNGSVRFGIRPETRYDRLGYADSVRYRTVDSTGRAAYGKLTVVVRDGAILQDDTLDDTIHGTQGKTTWADVLANDEPGLDRDRTSSSFDRGSLRFPPDQPDRHAVVTDGGWRMKIPRVGTFAVVGGLVRFDPERTFSGTTTFQYRVSDRVGNVAEATAAIAVAHVVPEARDLSAVTTYLHEVAVDLRPLPSTVTFAGFVSGDGTIIGGDVKTAQGEWYAANTEGPPSAAGFYPAPGFSGVASIPFEVVDANGSTATATMRVTVRRGWTAEPDTARTVPGADVTVDPLANDVPSRRLDDSLGTFEVARLRFSDTGQPTGATLGADGKTITLPGRGSAWISHGKFTFRPQAGFTGYVGRLALDVQDENSDGGLYPYDTLLDRVAVLVVGSAPVATDDSATTVPGTPVTLAGATNDDPGAETSLTTSFPPGGQPTGGVLSRGGTVLTVPGQGVWSVDPAGSVTFTPEQGFEDGAAPVRYQVEGAGGAAASATLFVSVALGPHAAPDSVVLAREAGNTGGIDPLANDLPGLNADGSPGTLDPGSIRFPVDGQPVGSVVSYDGRVLTVPRAGTLEKLVFSSDDTPGLVVVHAQGGLGPSPAITYEVQDSVVDATGRVVHHTTTSTLRAVFVGRDPVAVDDTATTLRGVPVRLDGITNDIPGSGVLRTDATPYFPSDQLAALPPGSSIRFCCQDDWYSTWDAFVTGEGYWEIDAFEGFVTFHPDADFVGTTTPVRYRIDASDGGTAEGVLTVTVTDPVPAVLRPDTAATRQGVAVTLDPLANDTPGTDGLPPDRLTFKAGVPAGATVPPTSKGTELVVPGQGRYDLALDTGRVTFTPTKSFRGTASPVRLGIDGQQSTLQVQVNGVDPLARDDSATTGAGTAVRVAVLANDAAGIATRPLVVGTARLTSTGLPSGASLSADGQLATLPGHGTFAVAGDGSVTFYPLAGTTGTVPPVTYQVADLNGTTTSASVAVRVT